MPKRPTKAKAKRKRMQNAAKPDAIALLKTDHRQAKSWFEEFAASTSPTQKKSLAAKLCAALTVHMMIEEEIFYPAFLRATSDDSEDTDIHHEAVVEHSGAKKLISEIEASDAWDEMFDARMTVLSEMIKHHVKEEEQPGGMFAEARKSEMDLVELGHQLVGRKRELKSASDVQKVMR